MAILREPRSWSDPDATYVQLVIDLHSSNDDDYVWSLVEVTRLTADHVSRQSTRIVAYPYRVIRGVFHFDTINESQHPPSVTCPESFLSKADVSERCIPWRRRWRAAARQSPDMDE